MSELKHLFFILFPGLATWWYCRKAEKAAYERIRVALEGNDRQFRDVMRRETRPETSWPS